MAADNRIDPLVSTQWLSDAIADVDGARDLCIVDATYFLPETGRDAAAEYVAAHIPGALHLNLAALVDSASALPNSVPPTDIFARHVAALGLRDGARIVFYDDSPHRTAARAWWLFRLHGVERLAILDGGLAKWRAEDRPLEGGPVSAPVATSTDRPFAVSRNDALLRSQADVARALANGGAEIVDARSAVRFTGEEAETRPGLASGHMPGARNLPYARFFAPDGSWKRGPALQALFEEAGVDLARPMITTCGSGITAAVVLFGAALLGKDDLSLYDGSWSEWGADPASAKASGPA